MSTAPAVFGDVKHVMAHLSEQNRAEAAALGMTDWQMLKQAREWVRDWPAVTILLDDEPVAVFGVIGVDEKVTWFLATPKFFDRGAASVFLARRVLRQMREKHGPLHSVSQSPRSDVPRWFRLLGYELVDDQPGRRVFRFG